MQSPPDLAPSLQLAALVFDQASRLRCWSRSYAGGVGMSGLAMIPGPALPHPVQLETVVGFAKLCGVGDDALCDLVDDVIVFDEEFRRLKNEEAHERLRQINARRP